MLESLLWGPLKRHTKFWKILKSLEAMGGSMSLTGEPDGAPMKTLGFRVQAI